MHADEVLTDEALVRNLIAAQFPHWSALPIRSVPSAGTDNALYRLGNEFVVRLPRIPSAVEQIDKEYKWLPKLGPALPLEVPIPVAMGEPAHGYPWPWSVYRWLDGETATLDRIDDPSHAALALARFIASLHSIDASHGPPPGEHNSWRGVPLITRDASTRAALDAVKDRVDVAAATAVWEAALDALPHSGPPRWIHGDLHAANLLATDGRLSAVIDFGCLGVGDPACDIMTAWLYLPADVRDTFRAALSVDEHTWTRARGWALSVGLIALPYYADTNPTLAAIAHRAIRACTGDLRSAT